MQKPSESLDDFFKSIEPATAVPPARVSLCPTGEIEVLRPLVVDQASLRTRDALLLERGGPRISWFHRSLIFGGAAAVAVTIIFLSALFIAVSEPSEGASADTVDIPMFESESSIDDSLGSESLTPIDENTTTSETSTPEVAPKVFGEFRAERRRVARSRRSPVRVQRAAYIPRRTPRPAQSPSFVPTTLVIYVENGEIKNRIEPTLTAAYKAPVTFSN